MCVVQRHRAASECAPRRHPAGPFCHRVLLSLEAKHIPYTKEYIDFNNKPQWCAAASSLAGLAAALSSSCRPAAGTRCPAAGTRCHCPTPRRLLDLNEGKVPVIKQGDFILHDSDKIVLWLEENYPQHPLPADAPADV